MDVELKMRLRMARNVADTVDESLLRSGCAEMNKDVLERKRERDYESLSSVT